MKHLPLFVVLFMSLSHSSFLAAATGGPRLPVVKVRSALSASSGSSVFSGSGVVFRDRGHLYALTSDHVVFHTALGVQNTVQANEGSRPVPASLRAVDWGLGLALLEIEDTHGFPHAFASVESLAPRDSVKAGQRVVLGGFPHASSSLLVDAQATVLNPASDRHEVAMQRSMIELAVGAHAEFGMSGGGVFQAGGGPLVGVLSHQFVEIVPGLPSHVATFGPKVRELQNHVLVIPAASAQRWVRMVLASEINAVSTFVLDPELQAQGRTSVLIEGLRFVTDCSTDTSGVGGSAGGGDGGGIGGSAGGGDGGGIGGPGGTTASCSVQVTLRRKDAGLPTGKAPDVIAAWAAGIRKVLESGRGESIAGFLNVDEQGKIRRRGVTSLAMMFGQTLRGNEAPMTEVEGAPDAGTRMAYGQALISAVNSVKAAAPQLDAPSRSLLSQLEAVGHWAASLSGKPMCVAQVESLEKHPAWDTLFHVAFDPSVNAMNQLIRTRNADYR